MLKIKQLLAGPSALPGPGWGPGCEWGRHMENKEWEAAPLAGLAQHHGLTSIISKMLSGSRLPLPTFLMHVTTPLLVTDTNKLAKEQASS